VYIVRISYYREQWKKGRQKELERAKVERKEKNQINKSERNKVEIRTRKETALKISEISISVERKLL
jgi:hypothetical protein